MALEGTFSPFPSVTFFNEFWIGRGSKSVIQGKRCGKKGVNKGSGGHTCDVAASAIITGENHRFKRRVREAIEIYFDRALLTLSRAGISVTSSKHLSQPWAPFAARLPWLETSTGCLFRSLKFEETTFTFLSGVATAISLWSSEPHERIAVCKAKALPSYLTIRPRVLVLLTKTKPSASHTSPHARESKTVVDSGFHPVESGFRAGTGNRSLFVSGTWILDSNC